MNKTNKMNTTNKPNKPTTLMQVITSILISLIAFASSVIALNNGRVIAVVLGAVLGVIYIKVSSENIKSYKLNTKKK